MPHNPQKLIEDIRISIREINDFCDGKKFSDFESAPLLQRAIEREMEIIGEVLNRLIRIDEEKLEEVIPEYRSIVGLRNIIAHGYDVVDPMVVWDVVINHVPVLRHRILTASSRHRLRKIYKLHNVKAFLVHRYFLLHHSLKSHIFFLGFANFALYFQENSVRISFRILHPLFFCLWSVGIRSRIHCRKQYEGLFLGQISPILHLGR